MLIPVGIEGETLRRMPYVSFAIAGACVLLFLVTWVAPTDPLGDSDDGVSEVIRYWSVHPNATLPEAVRQRLPKSALKQADAMHDAAVQNNGPASEDIEAQLALLASKIGGDQPETLLVKLSLKRDRSLAQLGLVTYMFVHLGWMHLIFNMLFFYLTGLLLESVWGRPVFAAFYLVGGVAAGITEWALTKQHAGFVAGASGAVAACMGAFAVRFASVRVRMGYLFFIGFRVLRGTFTMAAWVAGLLWLGGEIWSYVMEDSAGVAVLAHIGGFGFGAAVALGFKALGIEKKYLEGALENEDVAYVRPPELDEAHRVLADGDLATARKLAGELLKKNPELTEAEVVMYRVERRQNLLNAANARLDRLLNRVMQKGDPVALHALLGDLGEDFEAKTVRPPTAARLVVQLDGSNQLSRRSVMDLLEVGSAAPGLAGAKVLLRRADEALRDGAHDEARALVQAAKGKAEDLGELKAQVEMIERRVAAESGSPPAGATAASEPAAADARPVGSSGQSAATLPPRLRSVSVAGADDAGLDLLDPQGRKAKLPWARIQALAAALAPSSADPSRMVPVTDLVIGWGDATKGPEVLRFSAPSLGLSVLFPGVPPKEAYAQWIKNAVERSGATVLPDKGAVMRGEYPKFASVDEMTATIYRGD